MHYLPDALTKKKYMSKVLSLDYTTLPLHFAGQLSPCTSYQEKRLRVNMGLKTLRDKVKQHQEKVGEKVLVFTIFLILLKYNVKNRASDG
jgi:hypothetical protein